MFISNNNCMVVVTCWYVLKYVDICYILIDNKVVKFGKEKF